MPKFGSIVSEWDERNVIGEIIVEILCASLCHNGWLFFFPSQWGESILCTQFFMWKSMQSHAVDCMLWYYCVMCTYCTIWLSSYLQSHFNLICMMCVLCVCAGGLGAMFSVQDSQSQMILRSYIPFRGTSADKLCLELHTLFISLLEVLHTTLLTV